MRFSDTYSDLYGNIVSLTREELDYFHSTAARIQSILGTNVPIYNRDHDELKGRRREALGLFYSEDPKDPAAECFITIDNYFIHECFEVEYHGAFRVEPQRLEDVICHELAHREKFRHGKGHTALTQKYEAAIEQASKSSDAKNLSSLDAQLTAAGNKRIPSSSKEKSEPSLIKRKEHTLS